MKLDFALTNIMISSILGSLLACAGMPSDSDRSRTIANPFSNYRANEKGDSSQNMIVRTKKGDRSVELEIPGGNRNLSDFVLPMSPAFKNGDRSPASVDSFADVANDQSYKNRHATLSDQEIIQSMPQGINQDTEARQDIERDLHLMPSEDLVLPEDAPSYLAAMDHLKALFRATRYEAALMEADELLKIYTTDPKIYQMRGTLLDRLGRRELALKSWNQALRFDPKNLSLKKFIERKQFVSDVRSK